MLTEPAHLALQLFGMLAGAEITDRRYAACQQRRRDKSMIDQARRLPAAGAQIADRLRGVRGRQQCNRLAAVIDRPAFVAIGERKRQLQLRIEQAFRDGVTGKMDYLYYPTEWTEPYRSRRKEFGLQLYSAMHIERKDKDRQRAQWAANYRAFDAPVALFFFMDAGLQTGSFLDYGMFLQSLMLAAVEQGLATCPQAALGEYPAIVKRALGYPDNSVLICGMALGYEDPVATVNQYRTGRQEVAAFTRWFE